MERLKKKKSIDVHKCITEMRKDRINMVQNEAKINLMIYLKVKCKLNCLNDLDSISIHSRHASLRIKWFLRIFQILILLN